MKRFFSSLVVAIAVFLVSGAETAAQGRLGVIGGISFSNAEKQSLNRSTMNKYHVGLTYQLKLPLGFSVQPSLQYHVKGAKLKDIIGTDFRNTCDLSIGYLELPVSFQWGPDLLLFRPFIDVTPYIGYGLNNSMSVKVDGVPGGEPFYQESSNRWKQADLKRFEYGLGVGVGVEIWKFQLIGRYNWNLGSLYNSKTDFSQDEYPLRMMKGAFSKGNNLGGFTLSLSFLF